MSRFFLKTVPAFVFALCSLVATSAFAEDDIGGVLTTELDGVTLTYHYSSGRQYDVKYGATTMSYLRKDVPGREWVTDVAYIARKLDDNLYYLNWHRPERTEYVSIVLDLDERILYTSALLEGTDRHFDLADIVALDRE